jgi:uncharacterized DUF497 family protein
MDVEFDPKKDAANLAKHGLSLSAFTGFDDEPFVRIDDRFDYGETRYVAMGRIGGRGHCLVFTLRGDSVRAISLRRANDKEMKRHEDRTP